MAFGPHCPPDSKPQTVIVQASGKTTMRAILCYGVEVHRCQVGSLIAGRSPVVPRSAGQDAAARVLASSPDTLAKVAVSTRLARGITDRCCLFVVFGYSRADGRHLRKLRHHGRHLARARIQMDRAADNVGPAVHII